MNLFMFWFVLDLLWAFFDVSSSLKCWKSSRLFCFLTLRPRHLRVKLLLLQNKNHKKTTKFKHFFFRNSDQTDSEKMGLKKAAPDCFLGKQTADTRTVSAFRYQIIFSQIHLFICMKTVWAYMEFKGCDSTASSR